MSNSDALKQYNPRLATGDILPVSSGWPINKAAASVEYVDGQSWDIFAANYADVIGEQTSAYMDNRWGADRIERVLVQRGGKTIAGALVLFLRVPFLSNGLAIVKWGPLWREKATVPDQSRLRFALEALKSEYADRRRSCLSIIPLADPDFGAETLIALQSLGFSEDASSVLPDRYLVNMAEKSDQLRASLGQKWRYNLKKSLRNDFDIKLVEAGEGLPVFMDLYDSMLGRKQFRDGSAVETLTDMVLSGEKTIKPIFMLTYHEGRATAGAVLSVAGDRAVYLYGATDDRALGLRAGYAMQWWIAEWLCGLPQVRWYDLGGADHDLGLRQFKKGFCGKSGRLVSSPPTYNYSQSLLAGMVGKSVYLARDMKILTSRAAFKARKVFAR